MTALERQIESIKLKFPKHILIFQLSTYCETYGIDAKIISKICKISIDIDLTKGGITVLEFDNFSCGKVIGELIKNGYPVAVLQAS